MSNFIWISTAAPTIWTYHAVYHTNSTFTVPQSGWYRIYCIGKSGDGGDNSGIGNYGGGGSGAAGGGSGGMAVSNLILSTGQAVSLTFNNGTSQFGSYLYATAGADGEKGDESWFTPQGGNGGQGYNGNVANYAGFKGGLAGRPRWINDGNSLSGSVGLNGG